MSKRVFVLLGIFLYIAVPAKAQQPIDLFSGYSYQQLDRLPNAIPGRNLSGIEVAVRYELKEWLGAVGEVDAHWGLPSLYAARSLNVVVGPQVSLPRAISPFAQALIGYGHGYSYGIWDNSFSTVVGGGLDLRITPVRYWRVIEVDDVITHYFGGTQHNPKISTGIVFRF
jgi:hypothetical protein